VRECLGVTGFWVEGVGGETLVNPSAETRLRSGDRLRVFGLPEQIDAFRVEAERSSG
jgi:Trk K+ transport system NAD-binding subunit